MSTDLNNIVSIKIGGQAGQGIKSVGLLFSKLAVRSGYNIYNHIEFPSLIRGGHNVMQINFSKDIVAAAQSKTDLLIALNQDTVNRHVASLKKGGGIVYDLNGNFDTTKFTDGVVIYPVPLAKLAADAGGKELFINIVALGTVVGLLKGNIEILKKLVEEEFANKGNEIVTANQKAAELGYKYALDNFKDKITAKLAPTESVDSFVPNMVINGAEAVALSAIASGLQFAAIYPMSPISNILAVLAENQEEYGYIYKQPEDEISAINMSLGASFAGARAMTATSGGGFCLMTEGYGLAGMTETPIVIVEGMRGGPATGLPTWGGQGDLQFVLHAHQDDFARIVLAAGDAKEAFEMTGLAFNLADKYQTPVVLLIDKNICENDQSFPFIDTSLYQIDRGDLALSKVENYQRFKVASNGISTRTIPGSGNFFVANSDEHDETGYSTEEIVERNAMFEKRMHKLDTCAKEDMQAPIVYGAKDAKTTIVSWGSTKGSILQALLNLPDVNFVQLAWLNPFPTDALKKILSKTQNILCIEGNYTGQLSGLIREKTGIEITNKLLKYDGRPFYPEEIIDKINSIVKGGIQ